MKKLLITAGTQQVADDVILCDDSVTRSKGLLGRDSLLENQGVLMVMPWFARFLPAFLTSIHMIGMVFSIAVVFLDHDKRVINAVLADPGQLKFPARPASYILEVHPTHLGAFQPGTAVGWTEK